MTDVPERDPLTVRGRILKEFRKVETQIATNPESWKKISFEAHKELCTVLGANFVEYPEFEFWFSRFLQGNFDWGCDRSSDSKAHSFTDLPLDVFEKVGEYLELHDRFQLRNVCKDIRAHVDNWDPKVTKIYYNNANTWDLHLKSRSKPYSACIFGLNEKNRFSPGFYRNPISFVMNILRLPKLKLETLAIYQQDVYWIKLIEELDESNRKLHVKKFSIFHIYNSLKMNLHFMIPGVLEEISLIDEKREIVYDIVESEQCQSAKLVYINSWDVNSEYPVEAVYDYVRLTKQLRGTYADGLKANFLKKLMKKGEVQRCVLCISNCHVAESQILSYFNEPEAMVPNFPSLRRYPIPGTNEFYEIEYRKEFVRLERKQ